MGPQCKDDEKILTTVGQRGGKLIKVSGKGEQSKI